MSECVCVCECVMASWSHSLSQMYASLGIRYIMKYNLSGRGKRCRLKNRSWSLSGVNQ